MLLPHATCRGPHPALDLAPRALCAGARLATEILTVLQAIKHCAQSQLDTAADTFAALVAIHELAQSKLVTDADVLDLYEWAILDIKPFAPEQYAATLGTLRARWAKANPKNPAAVQCLEACVRRWDLVSAQQVGLAACTHIVPPRLTSPRLRWL